MGNTPRDCGPGVGNGWALFLSGGELSLVGSCPRTPLTCNELGIIRKALF